MPKLLSGSTLRRGGSGEFIDLKGAQPQLPPTDTTETGFTLVTDSLFRTTYRSSLGYIDFQNSEMSSQKPDGTIRIMATGTSFYSLGVNSGNLVVEGGVGIGGNLHIQDDAVINEITFGKGYEGLNNIVIRGIAQPLITEDTVGQNTIVIGYNALTGLEYSFRNIAIGNYALNSGTQISNNIAIGEDSLRNLGLTPHHLLGTITNVTLVANQTITNITNASPAVVSVTGHGFSSGDKVYINEVVGLTTSTYSPPFHIVNDRSFYINVTGLDTFELFIDEAQSIPLDTTSATSYTSNGIVVVPILLTSPNHIANSGTIIIVKDVQGTEELNGQTYYADPIDPNTVGLYTDILLTQPADNSIMSPYISSGSFYRVLAVNHNIAVGHEAGKSLVDGSRNFFIGDEVAKNLTTGSNNFFVGHQVANNVFTGSGIISIGGDNIINGKDNQVNIGSVFYFDGDGWATINAETTIGLGSDSTGTDYGALTVIGGVAIAGNIYMGGSLNVVSTLTSQFTATVNAVSTTTGALTVAGGMGIGKDLYVGGLIYGAIAGASSTATNLAGGATGSIPYQINTGETGFIPIGSSSTVLTSDGTTATWVPITSLTASTASEALSIFSNQFTNTSDTYYIGFTNIINNFSNISSDNTLYFSTLTGSLYSPSINVTDTTFSTSTVTSQAMTIDGGLGVRKTIFVQESVYSREGIVEEGNLLYTPRTTIDTSPPGGARLGDFWVKSTTGALYMYILDGTSTIWLQVTV